MSVEHISKTKKALPALISFGLLVGSCTGAERPELSNDNPTPTAEAEDMPENDPDKPPAVDSEPEFDATPNESEKDPPENINPVNQEVLTELANTLLKDATKEETIMFGAGVGLTCNYPGFDFAASGMNNDIPDSTEPADERFWLQINNWQDPDEIRSTDIGEDYEKYETSKMWSSIQSLETFVDVYLGGLGDPKERKAMLAKLEVAFNLGAFTADISDIASTNVCNPIDPPIVEPEPLSPHENLAPIPPSNPEDYTA